MARLIPTEANWLLTKFCYRKGVINIVSLLRSVFMVGLTCLCLLWANTAQAQSCGQATTQGTAPASWQTYCWLSMASYNDAIARSASGQNLSFALPDGSTFSFNVRVTGGAGTAYNSATAPSWTGAAIGNSAFIGIPGRPVLYTASAGTRTVTLSGIAIIPPAGGVASVFSLIVADAESSNENEALRLTTNGAAWQLLDNVPPIGGNLFPSINGVGSSNVNITGVSGNVGAYILGTNSPTSVSVETQAGGLQGVMFAVRFASIRLQASILGTRISAADQFRYQVVSSASGASAAEGVTSGSGGGPYSLAPLVMTAGFPISLRVNSASGSVSAFSQYQTRLTCMNNAGVSRSSLPNNVSVSDFSLGVLEFGEALVCTFTIAAQPRVALRKALGSGGRRFNTDQFIVRIRQGDTVIASSATTGSSGSVGAGNTGTVQLIADTSYTLDEIAANGANLGNYTATIACSNTTSGSATSLPTAVPGVLTPQAGDVIDCVITNTRRNSALLIVEKTSTVISDPVNGTVNPKAIPGAIVEYKIEVRNVGNRSVDNSTIFIIDEMPTNVGFLVGTPITLVNGAIPSGLNTFNSSTMVRFSSSQGSSGPFVYIPTGPVDRNVRAIRIAPTGVMAAASSAASQPSFSILFRARIE